MEDEGYTTRIQYIRVKSTIRETREGMKEYKSPAMKAEAESRPVNDANIEPIGDQGSKQRTIAPFQFAITGDEVNELGKILEWYSSKRRLINTGLTPIEMRDRKVESRLLHPIEQAYGMVYDAIALLNERTGEDDKEGLALIHKALELDPMNEEALYILCDVLMTSEDPSAAKGYVDRLIEVNPDSPAGYRWKAQLVRDWSGGMRPGVVLDKMKLLLDKAYSLDPEDFDTVAFCAQVSYWRHEVQDFERLVSEMHSIDPERAERFMANYFIFEPF